MSALHPVRNIRNSPENYSPNGELGTTNILSCISGDFSRIGGPGCDGVCEDVPPAVYVGIAAFLGVFALIGGCGGLGQKTGIAKENQRRKRYRELGEQATGMVVKKWSVTSSSGEGGSTTTLWVRIELQAAVGQPPQQQRLNKDFQGVEERVYNQVQEGAEVSVTHMAKETGGEYLIRGGERVDGP